MAKSSQTCPQPWLVNKCVLIYLLFYFFIQVLAGDAGCPSETEQVAAQHMILHWPHLPVREALINFVYK